MKKATHDDLTGDLFTIPQPEAQLPGCMDYSIELAHLVSQVMKESAYEDRYAVAAKMSRLTGRDVTKNMLDAYASEARETHNMPFYLIPVLEATCESYLLSSWLVGKRGGRMLIGREVMQAELGKWERKKNHASQMTREIKKQLEQGSSE